MPSLRSCPIRGDRAMTKLPRNSWRICLFAGLTFVGLIGLFAPVTTSVAQDYPSRPIRMVIAFPPGGPTDFVGRLLADKMKELIGQSVIIENRAGANGAIGAVAITPGMRSDLPYDTLRDFAPITLVVRNTTILVVRADLPLNSAGELAARAKEKPGEIAFASTGVGSMPHLAIELFQ